MSRIIANNIRHNDATADSLSFDSSGNVSVPNDLAVNTDTLFVDVSADQVGIGTSSPQASLHIGNGTGNGVEIGNNGTLQVIDRGNSRIEPLTVTAEHVAFSIARNSSTTLHDERARFTYDGLTFNGDTAAANALDDYEEGTWTVGYSFSGGNGTSAITGSSASYTKIGRMVYVAFDIALSLGTASGNFTITGLPFARGGSSLRSGLHPTFLVTNTLTNALRLYISDSSTTVNLYDGTGTNAYNATKMGSGSSFQLIAQGCYQIG